MWKESYKIGVELIDIQHKELFDKTEKLLHIIQNDGAVVINQQDFVDCVSVILFLKNYAVNHFGAEEGYMLAMNYSDLEKHKAIHADFTQKVLEMERRLNQNLNISTIKEMAGFLSAWLIYHVVGTDQKFGRRESLTVEENTTLSSYIHCFADSAQNVLNTMIGLTADNLIFAECPGHNEHIKVMIGLVGDRVGDAVFSFSKNFALSLFKAMTGMELTEIDELLHSALSEITNIISGGASALISASGRESDITTPRIITDIEGDSEDDFYLDTSLGRMAVSLHI